MISIHDKFKSLFEVNKEWNYLIARHLTDSKCICTSQSPILDSNSTSFNDINKNFRTIPDPSCSICEGAGYIFEEYLFKSLIFLPSFRVAHFEDEIFATTEQNILTAYIVPNNETEKIYTNDILFNVDSTIDGKLKHPIIRYKKWVIIDKQPIRLDRNRLEYIKIFAKPAIL